LISLAICRLCWVPNKCWCLNSEIIGDCWMQFFLIGIQS
jgi:hypothetical protein